MAAQLAGLSTLGIKFGYAVETSPGVKPSAFTQIERCNSIDGITLDTEEIDASALEDYVTRYIPGRQDTGGSWSVTFNYTPEVVQQLKDMISAYNTGKASSLNTWFEVWTPQMTSAFFVVAAPPRVLAIPEIGQNELFTIDVDFTIERYIGDDTGIEPVAI